MSALTPCVALGTYLDRKQTVRAADAEGIVLDELDYVILALLVVRDRIQTVQTIYVRRCGTYVRASRIVCGIPELQRFQH
jgi:hypothetical protein